MSTVEDRNSQVKERSSSISKDGSKHNTKETNPSSRSKSKEPHEERAVREEHIEMKGKAGKTHGFKNQQSLQGGRQFECDNPYYQSECEYEAVISNHKSNAGPNYSQKKEGRKPRPSQVKTYEDFEPYTGLSDEEIRIGEASGEKKRPGNQKQILGDCNSRKESKKWKGVRNDQLRDRPLKKELGARADRGPRWQGGTRDSRYYQPDTGYVGQDKYDGQEAQRGHIERFNDSAIVYKGKQGKEYQQDSKYNGQSGKGEYFEQPKVDKSQYGNKRGIVQISGLFGGGEKNYSDCFQEQTGDVHQSVPTEQELATNEQMDLTFGDPEGIPLKCRESPYETEERHFESQGGFQYGWGRRGDTQLGEESEYRDTQKNGRVYYQPLYSEDEKIQFHQREAKKQRKATGMKMEAQYSMVMVAGLGTESLKNRAEETLENWREEETKKEEQPVQAKKWKRIV